jgi:hypothetical protein
MKAARGNMKAMDQMLANLKHTSGSWPNKVCRPVGGAGKLNLFPRAKISILIRGCLCGLRDWRKQT